MRMRRRDREIKEQDEVIEILKQGQVCHLAMCKDNIPYVIPMLYVYDDNCVYFHCAEVGHKLDILRENNNVCFEVQVNGTDIIKNGGMPCDWGYAFKSAIGFGKAEIINEENVKIKIYDLMVAKMKPADYEPVEGQYVPKKIKFSFIIKVEIESISGKQWDGHK